MKKMNIRLGQTQWFIVLWFAGFLGLGVIAGLFKVLLYFAYP
ncbi:DUF2474 domain-containing protein [Acinetobacter sp.]